MGLSREPALLGMVRSAGATLTVVIKATTGSETLRPRTAPLGDPADITGQVAFTQTLHPHMFVINLGASTDD